VSKQLLLAISVALVVMVTGVLVVRTRNRHQKPASPPSITETNKMPRLDTTPLKFPE